MHIPVIIHGHPSNFILFENWINNSLNYGSKPYCREIRFYDIQVREEYKDKLLADLKNYYCINKSGVGSMSLALRMALKILKLDPIDMDSINASGKKINGIKGGFLLCPVGSWKDAKNYLGEEEI